MNNSTLLNLKNKIEDKKRILFYVIPLIVLLGYMGYKLINSNCFFNISGYYLFHYLYNYSHGYVTRGLVGQILHILFPVITPAIITGTKIIISVLFIFVSSFGIGRSLEKACYSRSTFEAVLCIILLLSFMPSAFGNMIIDDKLDRLYWLLTLIAVYIADTKYGVWFCPILCVAATAVNVGYVFTAMLLIAIVLLQLFYEHNYSKKYLLICIVTYSSIIALVLWGMISQQKLGFNNEKEFAEYFLSGYSEYPGELSEFISEKELHDWFGDYFLQYGSILDYAYNTYFVDWGNGPGDLVCLFLIALPCFSAITPVWFKALRHEKNKMQKFIFFLCMISWIVIIPSILISWEAFKYVSLSIIVNLCLLIWFLVRKNEAVVYTINAAVDFMKNNIVFAGSAIAYIGLIMAL